MAHGQIGRPALAASRLFRISRISRIRAIERPVHPGRFPLDDRV